MKEGISFENFRGKKNNSENSEVLPNPNDDLAMIQKIFGTTNIKEVEKKIMEMKEKKEIEEVPFDRRSS